MRGTPATARGAIATLGRRFCYSMHYLQGVTTKCHGNAGTNQGCTRFSAARSGWAFAAAARHRGRLQAGDDRRDPGVVDRLAPLGELYHLTIYDIELATDFQRIDREALGSQHVPDLRGSDPEGDGSERAVRGRVAVPASYCHARSEADGRCEDPRPSAEVYVPCGLISAWRGCADQETSPVGEGRRCPPGIANVNGNGRCRSTRTTCPPG